jgi:uncharacterized protein YdhG (YjbR/CyaY superfamily)
MNNPESSTNTSLLMPVAFLLVLLSVPLIHAYMHSIKAKHQAVYPLVMKIPIDSSVITAPSEAKQYEGFEVKLNLDTQQLAKFINQIVSVVSEGTSIQGVTGLVSPNMKAEISGKHYRIENSGPQEQLYVFSDFTEWKWQVVPESSGVQTIQFKLHLTTTENNQQKVKVVNLAEANIQVERNLSMWLAYNWWLISLLTLLVFAGWKVFRR